MQATERQLQLYLARESASPRVVISQSITHFLEHLKQTETTHISMGTRTRGTTPYILTNKLRIDTYHPNVASLAVAVAGPQCLEPGAPVPPLHTLYRSAPTTNKPIEHPFTILLIFTHISNATIQNNVLLLVCGSHGVYC